MGGLCASMANLVAGEAGSDERPGREGEEKEEESWEKEVNMGVFYTDAVKYWEGIPATVEGMLGGFGRHSTLDINNSKKFLLPLIKGPEALVEPYRALDCGSGIGRVTKRLLLPLFSTVDMVEQNASFLEKSKVYLGPAGDRVEQRIAKGLQEFTPERGRYDVIWCQWVLSHLSDDDLVSFLHVCAQALPQRSGDKGQRSGLIVVKENISLDKDDVFDDNDSSVTRSLPSFNRVFSAAGLEVVREDIQRDWPKELFQVRMFALRPLNTAYSTEQ